MKILIINQPISNHGDEAAHKALVRLLQGTGRHDIRVLFQKALLPPEESALFKPNDLPHVEHIHVVPRPHDHSLMKLATCMPLQMTGWVTRVSPALRAVCRHIREADLVLSAPHGVNIGPYKTWPYVWRLRLALAFGKKVAVYSISFGPLPRRTLDDRLFSRAATGALGAVGFLGLRETKSQEYATALRLRYTPSIDTVFSGRPEAPLPEDLEFLRPGGYVVVVPNELHAWHPSYRRYEPAVLTSLYARIVGHLLETGRHVVLMPQLFCLQDDRGYLEKLAAQFPDGRVITLPAMDTSEIQQAVIREADMVVGARNHAVVFSINNATPFLGLSYEHKMSHMALTLGLEDLCVDLADPVNFDVGAFLARIDAVLADLDSTAARVKQAREKARTIALSAFAEFARAML